MVKVSSNAHEHMQLLAVRNIYLNRDGIIADIVRIQRSISHSFAWTLVAREIQLPYDCGAVHSTGEIWSALSRSCRARITIYRIGSMPQFACIGLALH